jgi:hypothetical protein
MNDNDLTWRFNIGSFFPFSPILQLVIPLYKLLRDLSHNLNSFIMLAYWHSHTNARLGAAERQNNRSESKNLLSLRRPPQKATEKLSDCPGKLRIIFTLFKPEIHVTMVWS